ncbi:Glu-tRNA(Gln) amidotransferase subunit GatD [Candidatus Pacearchaeota archaeon]|nr:Glu-tRNA(Gln) amidotransferase subunit GatD [Candidatus Pacearchaeota archaeon]
MPDRKPQTGDYVEIHLSKLIYLGILLEVPGNEKGVVLLKLDSGYNVGFNRKDILKIKFLRKIKSDEKNFEIKKSSEKPNIAMIITGGTIASRYDSRTGGVKPLTKPEELFKYYPELFELVNVSKIEIPFMKASEDMDFKDWQKIARIASGFLNDGNIKGIIITHGTDFLHYTSAALSFFLKNLSKPVVLTYSQRSSDRASSDANLNLRCAALAAISDIAEVMIVGHATTNDDYCYAMPGTKTRKMHSSARDAFKTINGKPFAKIYGDRIEIISHHKKREKGKTKIDSKFEPRIALIKIYPGQNPDLLDFYSKKKYKGLVLECSGLGHVPSSGKKSWLKKIKEIQKKGIVVCITSQTIFGRVDPFVYSNARELFESGAIYLEDMLAETAFVKLGWILARTKNREEVKKLMLTNFAGELNEKLEFQEI